MPDPVPADSASHTLPPHVQQVLNDLLEAAKAALGPNLKSFTLFGSAAEGQMRATSDVNLLLVLARFERAEVDRIRDPLRVAHAAARVAAMFVLESELPAAAEAFAVKFADMRRRRRVLFGTDPLAGPGPSRAALIRRLSQVLVNLVLRLRSQYALVSLREEQLALVLADAAGPLRASAAALLELEGHPADSPKAALAEVAKSAGLPDEVLAQLSEARETRALPAGSGATLLFQMLELAGALRQRAERLGAHESV